MSDEHDIQRIILNGYLAWLLPDGRIMPAIAGGSDEGDDGGDGAGDDGGQGDGDDGDGGEDDLAKLRRQARHHESENRKLKARLAEAEKAEERLKAIEDEKKTEAQRAAEAREAAEREAAEAKLELARTRVALRKGLTEAQAKRLQGSTEEELEADADELLATFRPVGDDDDEGDDPLRRPRERLRSGNRPDPAPEERDPRKLAASLPRY